MIVLDNLYAIILPNANTAEGGAEVDTNGFAVDALNENNMCTHSLTVNEEEALSSVAEKI